MQKYTKLIALTVVACIVPFISLLIDPLLSIFSSNYFQPPPWVRTAIYGIVLGGTGGFFAPRLLAECKRLEIAPSADREDEARNPSTDSFTEALNGPTGSRVKAGLWLLGVVFGLFLLHAFRVIDFWT